MNADKNNYKKATDNDNLEDDIMPTLGQNISELTTKSEIEIDKNGIEKTVDRAKIQNKNDDLIEVVTNKNIASKPSEAAVDAGKRMVENQDKNSDIASNRDFE